MKLFVWDKILQAYTYGVAFALAETVEEARTLILARHRADHDNRVANIPAKERAIIEAEIPNIYEYGSRLPEELEEEPDIYDTPIGLYLPGGG